MTTLTREQIFHLLRDALVELFEIDAGKVTPEANLYTDLDIDSIDAVDLMIRLKAITGQKMQPEQFKNVRTVKDVVEAVVTVLEQPSAA
jgi:acyl carrier protein